MSQWDDIEIVDLDQAKKHTGITSTTDDEDLEGKLREAHEVVLDYVDRADDEDWHAEVLAWDADSAPKPIRAAILRQFADLDRFRGGDTDDSKVNPHGLSPRVAQLLSLYRDPPLA